jgi:hypothetical protein
MKERLSTTRPFEDVELQAQKSVVDGEEDGFIETRHILAFNRARIQRGRTQKWRRTKDVESELS